MRLGIDRERAGALAARTPVTRDRYVDLLRVLAIATVVVGHWLAVSIVSRNGRLTGVNVLAVLGWTQALTWLAQVMPLFFLVGGYVNATSWRSARGRGATWWAWLAARSGRLLRPTTVFVTTTVVAAAALRFVGVDPAAVVAAGWLVGISLWFLAVYLAVVALTPVTLALHERYGMRVWAVLGLAVAAVDVVRLAAGMTVVGAVNYLLVWVAVHQLGYAWRDGRLLRPRWAPAGLAAAGAAMLVALVAAGPYPASMVAVPGAELSNTSPPSLALLALAVTQAGIALLLRAPAARLCARPRIWLVIVAANRVVMSLYLWHLVPVAVAAALLSSTGLLPSPAVGSGQWYALRPVWLTVLAALFAPLLLAVARFERPSPPSPARPTAPPHVPPPGVAGPAAIAAVLAICAGLVQLTVGGLSVSRAAAGIPLVGLVPYGVGVLLFRLLSAWSGPISPGGAVS